MRSAEGLSAQRESRLLPSLTDIGGFAATRGCTPCAAYAAIPAHPQKQYTRRWRLYHFCGFYYPIREVIPIAIYHCNISIVSRGKGKSAVAAAAYRSGEKLTNEWDGMTHDYTRKGGVVHTEILLPPNAPPSFSDRSTCLLYTSRSSSPPKYLIFFKGRDADALTAAFTEYTGKKVRKAQKTERPSVLAKLSQFKELVKHAVVDRNKRKELER